MNRKQAPYTPPAMTADQALSNIEQLLAIRNAGWDRTAVRDVIAICYGSTEAFIQAHVPQLKRLAIMEKANVPAE
jgi:hypothetical protein